MDPIQTEHCGWPIPQPWRAWRDPEGRYGFGRSEAEAVEDLLEKEADSAEIAASFSAKDAEVK